jgi:hypothetical protein
VVVGVPGVGPAGKSFVGNTMTPFLGKNYLEPGIITTWDAANQSQALVRIHIAAEGIIRIVKNGGRVAGWWCLSLKLTVCIYLLYNYERL